jgi:hypothetical protein
VDSERKAVSCLTNSGALKFILFFIINVLVFIFAFGVFFIFLLVFLDGQLLDRQLSTQVYPLSLQAVHAAAVLQCCSARQVEHTVLHSTVLPLGYELHPNRCNAEVITCSSSTGVLAVPAQC